MGMFDKMDQLKNAPFSDGDFFIFSATYKGMTDHPEYGRNHMAEVVASATEKDEQDTYIVYGVMAEQVARIENGDLPAKVKLGKDGRANILVKVE